MASSWTEARSRAEIVAAGATLARRGLVRGPEGNLSCRLDDEAFLLTPRGAEMGHLYGPALTTCRLGRDNPANASSELGMHAAVLAAAPEVNALVHAHPPSVLALSRLGEVPEPGLLLEGTALVGSVATVPAWPPGSAQLAEACAEAVRLAPVVVLTGHGALAVGRSLAEAVLRLEVVELAATIALAGRDRR